MIRTVRDLYRTTNPLESLQNIKTFSKLSRDKRWLDVWTAFSNALYLNNGPPPYPQFVSALFQDLDKLVTTDESYQEVFLAMQMLLEIDNLDVINAKCQFIDSFYSGLEYIEPVIEAFGVSTQDIRKWNEATIFVDALVQLLKESRSHENLMKFLAFHGKFTTVKDDPSASLELIGDIIVYLNK